MDCPAVVRATRAYFGRCLLLPNTGLNAWGSGLATTNAASICVAGSSCAADGMAPSLFAATQGTNDAKITTSQANANSAYTWWKTWQFDVNDVTIRACADTSFNVQHPTDAAKSFISSEGVDVSNIWARTWISLASNDNLAYHPRNLDSKYLTRLGTFTGYWTTGFTAATSTQVSVTYQNTESQAASLTATLTLHDGGASDFKLRDGAIAVKGGDLLGFTVTIANSPIDSDLVVAVDSVKFCNPDCKSGGVVVDQLLLGQGVYDNFKPKIQSRGVAVVNFPFQVLASSWTFQVTGTLTPPGCSTQGHGPLAGAGNFENAWTAPESPGFLYDVDGTPATRSKTADTAPPCSSGRRFLLQTDGNLGDLFVGAGVVTVDAPEPVVSSASSATLSAAVLLVAAALL